MSWDSVEQWWTMFLKVIPLLYYKKNSLHNRFSKNMSVSGFKNLFWPQLTRSLSNERVKWDLLNVLGTAYQTDQFFFFV